MANYPYFGVPPSRRPRPVSEEPALTGKRVVLSTPEGFVYDMRAAGELRTDGEGNLVVDILAEVHYFEQRLGPSSHQPVAWPAHLVWVD
ncbi:MAG: hypothetical protein WB441_05555 [Nocardioidaceae bacterium]